MQQEPVKLRPRLGLALPAEGAGDPRELVVRAITRRRCVRATYNRQAIELAPHILYEKHGEAYVDGVVLLREGKPPRELKLGAFKLSGLAELAPAGRPFDPQPLFRPDAERYLDATIASV